MFKTRKPMLLLVVVVLLFSGTIKVQASDFHIDKSQVNKGVVRVNYEGDKDVLRAVRITKDNKNYDYFLDNNNSFPLQDGNGDYTILILENIEGKKFKQVEKDTIKLNLTNKNEVYLQPIQTVNWNNGMDPIKKAKELTKDAKSDREKVERIYEYVVNSIEYDNEKVDKLKLKQNYIPSIEDTFTEQKGICYDYSALFGAMLRSVDIPTKLVMGYKNDIDVYHAWNQVYLEDVQNWVTIDTTYDAGMSKGKIDVNMIKNQEEYKIEKEY